MKSIQLIGKKYFLDGKKLSDSEFRDLVKRRAINAYQTARNAPEPIAKTIDIPKKSSLLEWQGPKEQDRKANEEFITMVHEKIHMENNLLPVEFLYRAVERSKAVCRIRVSGGYGTGTLIGNGLIMTNNHVISNLDEANSAYAEFFYENASTAVSVKIRPDMAFITDKNLDFTIVGCEMEGLENVQSVPLLRNPATVTRNERVNIIQHPRGREKEVALHDNRVSYIYDKLIHYHTDTEPGSSGSPVFNNEWELVALHHAGQYLNDGTQGALNEGIRISAIVDHILSRRGINNEDETYSQVLETIQGSAPTLGFFDVAGLFPTNDPSFEIEVPDYIGNSKFADVGFWNIRHFNNNAEDARIEKVANLVSTLSMDVLGLTEVQDGALDKMIARLRTRGVNMDYVYLDAKSSPSKDTTQDLAVLYDIETTEVTKLDEVYKKYKKLLNKKTSRGSKAWAGGRLPLFTKCKVREEGDPTEFIMIVVHLKARFGFDNVERRRLAAGILGVITEKLREEYKLPVIVGGDYNELINSGVLNDLQNAPDMFSVTIDDQKDDAISYVGQSHRSLIDHIVLSNDAKLGQIRDDDNAIVRLDKSVKDYVKDISDHVPVVIRLTYRSAEAEDMLPRVAVYRSLCEPVSENPMDSASRALARVDANRALYADEESNYYNSAQDKKDKKDYYKEIDMSSNDGTELYYSLSQLLRKTHTGQYSYRHAKGQFLYPLVDLKVNGGLNSVYSDKPFDPEEIIKADLEIEIRLQKATQEMEKFETFTSEVAKQMALEELESQYKYNCEHVVCQSWFGKTEPMKGDLHHLFTCDPGCNSSRSNHPYKDFLDYTPETFEGIRDNCGKSAQSFFEPENHKGIVARATLYFLVRYPNAINEYGPDGIELLKRWDQEFPVSTNEPYELHRNQSIFAIQGNRNPFIDFNNEKLSQKVQFG